MRRRGGVRFTGKSMAEVNASLERHAAIWDEEMAPLLEWIAAENAEHRRQFEENHKRELEMFTLQLEEGCKRDRAILQAITGWPEEETSAAAGTVGTGKGSRVRRAKIGKR